MFLKIFFLLCLSICGLSHQNNLQKAFIDSGLEPDLVPKAPEKLVHVTFADVVINLGDEVSPTQTVKQPDVSFDGDDDCYYTLLFLDPDAFYPDTILDMPGQYYIWGVGNIKGNVSCGQELVPYLYLTPPPYSVPHRNTFLVYKQKGYIQFDEEDLNPAAVRPIFCTQEFVKKHCLGDPEYGNFFRGVSVV